VACSAEMHTSVICASDASAFPPPLCVTGPDGRERAVLKQRLRDAPAWLRLVRSWSPRRRPARSARACRREGVALNRRQRRARGASRRCQPRRHRRGRRRWALPAASAALQPRRAQAWTWQTKEASTRSLRARPCFRRAALWRAERSCVLPRAREGRLRNGCPRKITRGHKSFRPASCSRPPRHVRPKLLRALRRACAAVRPRPTVQAPRPAVHNDGCV
jgi:hypothetical protein